MDKLGLNIRKLRHAKGWSQGDIAAHLQMSTPAFSKIETGVTDINLSRLQQIAALFGITVIELLAPGEDDTHRKRSNFNDLHQKLLRRETEVIELQKKVIELFEELKKLKFTA